MKRVLLVDNDPDILELLSLGLSEYGFDVTTAASGLEALRALEADVPDAIITDLIMPEISGEKLLRIVGSVPEWSALATIVVSGVAAEAPEIRQRVPCDIYIAKGPIGETLRHIVAALRDFERVREISASQTIGLEGLFHRHVTRELLDFRSDVEKTLDLLPDGVCTVNREGMILWLNQRFARYVAQPEEALLGRSLGAVVGQSAFEQIIDLATQNNESTVSNVAMELTDSLSDLRVHIVYGFERGDGKAAILWRRITGY